MLTVPSNQRIVLIRDNETPTGDAEMTDYQEMINAVNELFQAELSPVLNEDEEGIVFAEFNIGGQRDVKAMAQVVWMERREDA